MTLFRSAVRLVAAMAIAAFAWPALAAWPEKPIQLVLPNPAGGAMTTFATLFYESVGRALGQSIVADYRAGAQGLIAAEYVSHARPDGYTIFMGTSTALTMAPHMVSSMRFDPLKDLTPVAMLWSFPNVLVVPAGSGVNSVADLVAKIRSRPGKSSFGSSGNGGSQHIAGQLFSVETGVPIVHVPYKGEAPALTDLMRGELDFQFASTNSLVHVASGRLKALAVTSAKRIPSAPDLPTMDELGYPKITIGSWFAIYTPAGTPPEVIDKLQKAIATALAQPEFRQRIAALGTVMSENFEPAYLERVTREDHARWKKFFPENNIKAE